MLSSLHFFISVLVLELNFPRKQDNEENSVMTD